MRKSNGLLIIIGLAIAIVNFFLLGINEILFHPEFFAQDGYSYIDSAEMLYKEFSFHPTRPAGYAFLIGLPNLFLKEVSINTYIIFNSIINLLFWLGTIILLNKNLAIFLTKKGAFIATLFFVFSVSNINQIFLVLNETVITFLLILAAYFFLQYEKSRKNVFFALAASILNFSVLIKPGMLYIALLVSGIFILKEIFKRNSFRKIHLTFLLSVLLIFGQCTAIYLKYGNFTISYIDKTTWYYYLGAKAMVQKTNSDFFEERERRHERLRKLNWREISNEANRDIKYQIVNNPDNLLRAYGGNLYRLSIAGSTSILLNKKATKDFSKKSIKHVFLLISRVQNFLYVLFGFLLILLALIKKAWSFPLGFALGCFAYLFFTSGISFWQGDRFNLVFFPLIIFSFFYVKKLYFQGRNNKYS